MQIATGRQAARPLDAAQRSMYVDAPLKTGAEPYVPDDFVPQTEMGPMQELLQEHCVTMRSIFRYYATSDVRQVDESLSSDEIWRLLTDCRMTTSKDTRNGISRGVAEDLVKKAALGKEALDPTDFVRFLIRLAAVRVKGSTSVTDKLKTLLEKTILRYANYSDTKPFLTQVYSAEVQSLLTSHKDWCAAIYRAYCKGGKGGWLGAKAAADRRMYIDEFVQLCTDLTLTDSILTQQSIRQVFLQTVLSDEKRDDGSTGELGLTYHQFLECICVLAAFKSPLPYFPLSRRVARFFDVWFMPLLSDGGKFKKVHDEYQQLIKQQSAKGFGTQQSSSGRRLSAACHDE